MAGVYQTGSDSYDPLCPIVDSIVPIVAGVGATPRDDLIGPPCDGASESTDLNKHDDAGEITGGGRELHDMEPIRDPSDVRNHHAKHSAIARRKIHKLNLTNPATEHNTAKATTRSATRKHRAP